MWASIDIGPSRQEEKVPRPHDEVDSEMHTLGCRTFYQFNVLSHKGW